jgi:hypothetical protein
LLTCRLGGRYISGKVWVYKLSFIFFILFSSFVNACGEDTEYSPIFELGEVKEKYINPSKLFIPMQVNKMELATVHFQVGKDNDLVLPIQFYANAEYPEIHKEGYATVFHTITEASIPDITVHANYKYPIGPNGEITFCIHSECFKLSELN